MAGDHCGAQAADQQGDHREDARFGKDRDADRQANAQHALDHRPLRPIETLEQLAALVRRPPARPACQAEHHHPHRNARGPAAAHAAHGRHSQMAIDEDVVQRDIQRQPAQAHDHARSCAAQAIAETAQHVIHRNGRHACGDAVQVAHGRFDQVRFNLHRVQDGFGAEQQQRRDDADHHRQPQGLAHQWPDLAVLACAEALGDFRRGGQ